MFINLRFDLRPIKNPKKTTTSKVNEMLWNLVEFIKRKTEEPTKVSLPSNYEVTGIELTLFKLMSFLTKNTPTFNK